MQTVLSMVSINSLVCVISAVFLYRSVYNCILSLTVTEKSMTADIADISNTFRFCFNVDTSLTKAQKSIAPLPKTYW